MRDTRETVLLIITGMVVVCVAVPVVVATLAAAFLGRPPANPAFLETMGNIITFALGMVSSYILTKPQE